MEAALFDEIEADKEVIKSLTREIERLQELIMRTIIKTVDGKFYDVSDRQELSPDEVNQIVAEVNQEANFLNALVAVAPAAPTDPTPPTDPVPPVDQPVESAPAADVPAPDQTTTTVDPAPVDPPTPDQITLS